MWVDWAYREALHVKAFLYTEQLKFDEALELLQAEIDVAPFAAIPHAQRGFILTKQKRHEESLKAYRRGLVLSREFESSKAQEPIALRGIGFALIEFGELKEATTMFRESLEIDPGNRIALNELRYIEHLEKKRESPDGSSEDSSR